MVSICFEKRGIIPHGVNELVKIRTAKRFKLFVVYALKHPYSDGTTHFLFHTLDLLARLAALVPRPRANLTRYHGVFAPNSKYRARIVPQNKLRPSPQTQSSAPQQNQNVPPSTPGLSWAQRLKRTFEFDLTRCPLCGGTLRAIADITDPTVIDNILTHIKTARAPPARSDNQDDNSPKSNRRAS